MGTKSKFFRAFVAGQTISDGRVITPEMISDIVATFNTDSYTPRINIEHISGYSPEPPFNGYGSVIAVKQQTDDIVIAGKTEKREALYCQVDANDQLVTLAAKDQKPFPSVELTDSYAGTGKVGMLALAFTDNPASIATQALKFSRSGPGTILAHSDAPAAIEFDPPVVQPDASAGAFAAMKAFFEKFTASPTPPAAPVPPVPPVTATPPATPANDNFAQLAEGLGLISASITALGAKVDTDVGAMRAEFGTLKTKLETTEAPTGFSRAPHAGGSVDAKFATDC